MQTDAYARHVFCRKLYFIPKYVGLSYFLNNGRAIVYKLHHFSAAVLTLTFDLDL